MFKKGYTPYNKGKKVSLKRAKVLRAQVLKVGKATRFKKGQKSWNEGKKLGFNLKQSETMKKLYSEGRIIPWNKGKKLSKKHIEKLRISHLGYIVPKLQRENIGKALKKSLKHKVAMKSITRSKKISDALKKRFSIKSNHPLWGKHHSEETILKMKEKAKLREIKFGSESPGWKGGLSKFPYPRDWTKTLRLAIRQRDNFTCQKCGITEEEYLSKTGRVLSVNHIDFDKTNCDPKNLNTLCVGCNSSVNTNREYWTNYFRDKITI